MLRKERNRKKEKRLSCILRNHALSQKYAGKVKGKNRLWELYNDNNIIVITSLISEGFIHTGIYMYIYNAL